MGKNKGGKNTRKFFQDYDSSIDDKRIGVYRDSLKNDKSLDGIVKPKFHWSSVDYWYQKIFYPICSKDGWNIQFESLMKMELEEVFRLRNSLISINEQQLSEMHWNKVISDEKSKLENVTFASGKTVTMKVSDKKVEQIVKDKLIHKKKDIMMEWLRKNQKTEE